ncbi:hypothetical protein NTD84_03320 [Pseudomonas sp. 14P_8.1_Bac3]|uniref:hypothetical protein n=1 Tax=Pseudomonas sp. 14P_8.1_Bac3 TaxID=2971621 RepID=UPI0021C9F2DA|nr:hypothetical protein [Pseudomonas sp. 14P_8.1_Bac3]MCU1758751.1 hypothetical protein [Pseudomonas sp. 14P_8.1_Bac3]
MVATVEVSCAWCKGTFSARIADRKRGWAKFCSKSCKAKKQEKRTGQNAVFHERREERRDTEYVGDEILDGMSDMDFGASDGGGYEHYI